MEINRAGIAQRSGFRCGSSGNRRRKFTFSLKFTRADAMLWASRSRAKKDGCRSGLTGTPGKRVWSKSHRGFESLPIRQLSFSSRADFVAISNLVARFSELAEVLKNQCFGSTDSAL